MNSASLSDRLPKRGQVHGWRNGIRFPSQRPLQASRNSRPERPLRQITLPDSDYLPALPPERACHEQITLPVLFKLCRPPFRAILRRRRVLRLGQACQKQPFTNTTTFSGGDTNENQIVPIRSLCQRRGESCLVGNQDVHRRTRSTFLKAHERFHPGEQSVKMAVWPNSLNRYHQYRRARGLVRASRTF